MVRPTKCRRVAFIPDITYFKPTGFPFRLLTEVSLSIEEAESLRLKDLEGLQQNQAAENMNVSRSTFQRVLVSARWKVADALINGKIIKIEGGNFKMVSRQFRCQRGCGWELEMASDTTNLCPTCDTSADIQSISLTGFESDCNKQRGYCNQGA